MSAAGVLTNNTDVDGDPLTANTMSYPSHGSLTLNANGSFLYTPAAGYFGTDSFTYQANDGILNSNTATVSITVNHVNHPPVAVNDSYSLFANQPLTVSIPASVTSLVMQSQAGDYIGQGQNYSYTSATGTFTANSNADHYVAVNYGDSQNNWGLGFQAPGGAYLVPGTYVNATRYPFELSTVPGLSVSGDGRGSNTLTGQFTVLQAIYGPNNQILQFDATFVQHNEGETPTLTGEVKYNYSTGPLGVLNNDSDPDGNPITAILVAAPAHGTVTLNADGTFQYTPATDYIGTDSFTYKANDGKLDSNVATVNLKITKLDHAPVANADTYSMNQDSTLTVAAAGVLTNDTDSDGDPLTAALVNGTIHGTLSFNADGSFSYTPAAGYVGSDSFSYQANDGILNSTVATVTINVQHVDHAPVAVNDTYSLIEDQTLSASSAAGIDSLVMQSQAGDYIGQGQNYSYTSATGTFSVNGNRNHVGIDYSGPTNSSVWWDLGFSAPSNGPLTPGTYLNATRDSFHAPDGPGLEVIGESRGSNTLTGQFTIVQAIFGSDNQILQFDATFVQHSEGFDPALTGEIRYNYSPTPIGVLNNDSDPDGDPITAILVAAPAHGSVTLNADGTFKYTPAPGYIGADSFTYKANDGQLDSNVATVNLTVYPSVSVKALPSFSPTSFPVAWSGAINAGIASYTVYVSDNGAPFTPFLTDTTLTLTNFTGVVGHTYRFFSAGTDSGQLTPTAQATTTVTPTNFSFQGTTLTVTGTGQADTFQFVAGATLSVMLNGTAVQVSPADVKAVVFNGNGGNDVAYLYGSPNGSNTLALTPGGGTLTGSGYALSLNGISTIQAHGKSGDVAYLYDASGQNTFVATPAYGFFTGTSFYNQEVGFSVVNTFAAKGTIDTAYLYDGGGSNVFVGTPTSSFMTGTGYYYYNQPVGFQFVNAFASSHSNDAAYLFDNGGANTLVATPTYSFLQGSNYFNQVVGFASVTATSAAAAHDFAYLFGNTVGGNVFTATSDYSYIYGTGFVNQAVGFKSVQASGTRTDTATFYDNSGDNVFAGNGSTASLAAGTLSYNAINFGYLNIVASKGSDDLSYVDSITYSLSKYGTWH